MKRLSFFMLLGIYLILNTNLSLAENKSGPKMIFEERSFNFGQVEEGELMEHSFKFLNKGDQPLQIKEVKPG